ncbi:hypothetical protein ACS0TY_012977 [Phlomoides rotata]
MGRVQPVPNHVGPSNTKAEENWWKTVWKLKIPPKVRIFLWKLSLDLVAKEAFSLIHDGKRFWNVEGRAFNHIRTLLNRCPEWEIFYILRLLNQLAHNLAQSAAASTAPPDWHGTEMRQLLQDFAHVFSR